MKNVMLSLLVLTLIGCGESPNFVMPDSGIVGDAGVAPDAWMEIPDAAVQADSATTADTGPSDAGDSGSTMTDGSTHDAATPEDGGSDAGVSPTSDAGTDASVGRGDVVELGVNGATTCVLTSTQQMWCWGGSMAVPTYVADAVALEGTCAIGTDGRAFCVGASAFGSDVSVVGRDGSSYVRRADGVLEADLGAPYNTTLTWAPPSAIEELPATNCAVLMDGTVRCWDTQYTTGTSPTAMFTNFMNLGAASDVARSGNVYTNTFRACTDASGIHCQTVRGTTGSALLSRGNEIEMAYGRACTIVRADWSGTEDDGTSTSHFHPAGIYCTSDAPELLTATGYWPFSHLPSSDVVGQYTRTDTSVSCAMGLGSCTSTATQLRVGSAHVCFIQDGHVQCWGDASHNQLGGASTSSTPVTVF